MSTPANISKTIFKSKIINNGTKTYYEEQTNNLKTGEKILHCGMNIMDDKLLNYISTEESNNSFTCNYWKGKIMNELENKN